VEIPEEGSNRSRNSRDQEYSTFRNKNNRMHVEDLHEDSIFSEDGENLEEIMDLSEYQEKAPEVQHEW
jgi:hypothetical protein